MSVKALDWHRRYRQQAGWTRELRRYLFKQVGLNERGRASPVLEVGCGTGAILSEIPAYVSAHGLDIDSAALAQCRIHAPAISLVQGNALQLPYSEAKFDIVYCHFLLLWVKAPLQALVEMKRVAKDRGHILAFAEPDYTARLDEPRELAALGKWQADSLRRQGADPALGHRLADLFFQAGIQIVETGTLHDSGDERSAKDWDLEWQVIESDLAGFIPSQDLGRMKSLDRQARLRGERVLHLRLHRGEEVVGKRHPRDVERADRHCPDGTPPRRSRRGVGPVRRPLDRARLARRACGKQHDGPCRSLSWGCYEVGPGRRRRGAL